MRDEDQDIPTALLTALEDLSAEITYVADVLALIASSTGEFGALSRSSIAEPLH